MQDIDNKIQKNKVILHEQSNLKSKAIVKI